MTKAQSVTAPPPVRENPVWTDEMIWTLRQMWAGGHTAKAIAGELGNVTASAVGAKVNRLGLSVKRRG
jgi:hypothetical protein